MLMTLTLDQLMKLCPFDLVVRSLTEVLTAIANPSTESIEVSPHCHSIMMVSRYWVAYPVISVDADKRKDSTS